MAAILGRKVKVERNAELDGSGAWSLAAAGTRNDNFKIDRQNADVTEKNDGGWKALLGDVTLIAFDIGVEGVFKDAQLMADAMNPDTTLIYLRVTIEGFGTATGLFALSNVSLGAPHDGETTFTADFMGSGTITWAAVV